MASFVLLDSISIMSYDYKHGAHHFELENEKVRSSRMASILGFSLDSKTDTREVVGYFNGRGAYVIVSDVCICTIFSDMLMVFSVFISTIMVLYLMLSLISFPLCVLILFFWQLSCSTLLSKLVSNR